MQYPLKCKKCNNQVHEFPPVEVTIKAETPTQTSTVGYNLCHGCARKLEDWLRS